jgi:hypothetical protein
MNPFKASRRSLLGAAALAPLAAAPASAALRPPAATSPDAELVELARALERADATVQVIESEGDTLPDGIGELSEELEQRLAEADEIWWSIAERACAIPARTSVGLHTRARMMRLMLLRVTTGAGVYAKVLA